MYELTCTLKHGGSLSKYIEYHTAFVFIERENWTGAGGGRFIGCARKIRHTHTTQMQDKISQIILGIYFDSVQHNYYFNTKMEVR